MICKFFGKSKKKRKYSIIRCFSFTLKDGKRYRNMTKRLYRTVQRTR